MRGDLWACEGGLEHEPAWRLGMIKEVDESGLFGLETRAEGVSLQGATGRSEVCDRRIAGQPMMRDILRRVRDLFGMDTTIPEMRRIIIGTC